MSKKYTEKNSESKNTLKTVWKAFKKTLKAENIFKFIIIIASLAIVVSSFLPYMLY